MYTCPSCKQKGISFFRKWISQPSLPARCIECNALSHSHYASGGAGVVGVAVILTLTGILASAVQSVWPLLFGVVVSLVFYVRHIHKLTLDPISEERVKTARQSEGAGLLTALLVIFFN